MKAKCGISGCEKTHYAKGMCQAHYELARNGKNVNRPIGPRLPQTKQRPLCGVPDCEKPHYARSLCQTHYQMVRRTEVGEELRCTVEGCLLRHVAKGYCGPHYDMRRYQLLAAKIKAYLPNYEASND